MSARAQTVPFGSPEEVRGAIPRLVDHMRSGGLIVHPTETVYGLGGGVSDAAIEAVRILKERPAEKTFLILVADSPMLEPLRLRWSPEARQLAVKFWPGPLTLVLDATDSPLPASLHGETGGIAVRWTSHPSLSQLLLSAGMPITSTSANPPGSPPASDASQALAYYRDALQTGNLLLLDAGQLPSSSPSTVVDCTSSPPRIVRPGAIAGAELRGTVPDLIWNE